MGGVVREEVGREVVMEEAVAADAMVLVDYCCLAL